MHMLPYKVSVAENTKTTFKQNSEPFSRDNDTLPIKLSRSYQFLRSIVIPEHVLLFISKQIQREFVLRLRGLPQE
jgi:hypothetical protein